MMRLKKLWIIITSICCGLFMLVACTQESDVVSIALNGYSADAPLEFTIGKFNFAEHTISALYENGETEDLPLTEDMISETDKLKFYQEGAFEIDITYKGVSSSVAISVSRNEFSGTVELKNFTATYTGKPFTVEVEGDIPGGTQILYPQGNVFQNAGAYDMTAVLQCDGYVTKILSARVVIEKATYDLSKAKMYDETATYDKDAHGITVKGELIETVNGKSSYQPASLPQGVSVSYTITKIENGKGEAIPVNKQQMIDGNKAIDAGVYEICAKYKGDAANYNAIPDSVAYLTIERAAYDLSKVEFPDTTVTYTGEENSLSIPENTKLPLDLEISYQIKRLQDGAGQTVKEEYKAGNAATDAGIYVVKASFQIVGKNAENYTAYPVEMEAYLTILRANYDGDMTGLYMDVQWLEIEEDGIYEIIFDCVLPERITPIFTLKNAAGEVIDGELQIVTIESEDEKEEDRTVYKYVFSVETEGNYSCVVTFSHDNANYEPISLYLEAWVFIGTES